MQKCSFLKLGQLKGISTWVSRINASSNCIRFAGETLFAYIEAPLCDERRAEIASAKENTEGKHMVSRRWRTRGPLLTEQEQVDGFLLFILHTMETNI